MTDIVTPPSGSGVLSRRRVLTGGAVAGGVALAATACGIGDPDPMSPTDGAIEAPRVDRVPADDALSRTWKYGYPTKVVLDGQTMTNPQRALPAVEAVTVRAIHDGTSVGFQLEWDCGEERTSTTEPTWFRDAAAVLLVPPSAEDLRPMGSATQPATLLHWKADWQRQVSGDPQGVPQVFPNRSVDYYPPLVNVPPGQVTSQSYVDAGQTQWLPGLHSHNPMSAAHRDTAVEKLTARRYGTAATCATQNASGHGVYEKGRWTAVMVKPLASTDTDELALQPGGTYSVAFAVWLGSTGDVGSRKSPSLTVHTLKLGA